MQTYQPGTLIGQYEIASKPMIGGMGVVYFCIDHNNNDHPVALKTFKPEYLPDRTARDRFLREGTAWVELGSHPHIVHCHAVEYIDQTAFLILELIAKEPDREDASLRSWMGSSMPIEQVLLFSLQIARGMQHANTKIPGFVHRDLKPENILVGADKLPGTNFNRLRVTDFGLASIIESEAKVLLEDDTRTALGRTHLTHGILGTPVYMAPEQWTGQPVGVYTDIYALGCILFEMLTGKRAADGLSVADLRAAHSNGRLQPVPEALPAMIKSLLSKCLALAQNERFQTWMQVILALEAVFSAISGQAAPNEQAIAQISREERQQVGWSYNAIGLSYKDMGRADVAKSYFEKAYGLALEMDDSPAKSTALCYLAIAHKDLGNF
ncbi:MAG: serine/threonine-protein kinase, partial [Chloroflexota bacterium]